MGNAWIAINKDMRRARKAIVSLSVYLTLFIRYALFHCAKAAMSKVTFCCIANCLTRHPSVPHPDIVTSCTSSQGATVRRRGHRAPPTGHSSTITTMSTAFLESDRCCLRLRLHIEGAGAMDSEGISRRMLLRTLWRHVTAYAINSATTSSMTT